MQGTLSTSHTKKLNEIFQKRVNWSRTRTISFPQLCILVHPFKIYFFKQKKCVTQPVSSASKKTSSNLTPVNVIPTLLQKNKKKQDIGYKAVIICSRCHSGSLKNQRCDIAVKTL